MTTDISIHQILAIVVRFYYKKVNDALLASVEVTGGSAQGLYTDVKKVLQERNSPMKNITAFASDKCNTMMGENAGFQAHLKMPAMYFQRG